MPNDIQASRLLDSNAVLNLKWVAPNGKLKQEDGSLPTSSASAYILLELLYSEKN